MNDPVTNSIRESYDRLAEEYTRRISDELQHKPLDRELLDRFTQQTKGRGEVCDMGCGPGHVARYLRDAGASVFGLDLSPGMVEQARKLNPFPFWDGVYCLVPGTPLPLLFCKILKRQDLFYDYLLDL